jgi:hypothetical protein
VHLVLDRMPAEVIGGPCTMPPGTPPPAIHIVKPKGW